MDVLVFNYLINQLLDKILKEQQIFLLGDFNINLLNYNEHQPTNEFLDSQTKEHLHTRYKEYGNLLSTLL